MLKLEWRRGLVGAALAARAAPDKRVDDDILREAILGDVGDSDGFHRLWPESSGFNSFLRERLPTLAAALAEGDPKMKQAIAATIAERERRWRDSHAGDSRRDRGKENRLHPD